MIILKLLGILEKAWDFSTSADPSNWTSELPAWGQCAVTALIVNDYFGGSILRISLDEIPVGQIAALKLHYYNEIRDPSCNSVEALDFTFSQFGEFGAVIMQIAVPKAEERARGDLLKDADTRRRYEILKGRVNEIF